MARKPIFEEVAGDTPRPALPAGGLIDARPQGTRGALRLWLWLLLALVATMFALGGAARLVALDQPTLTAPLKLSLLPPRTDAAWAAEAAAYMADPGVSTDSDPAATLAATQDPAAGDAAATAAPPGGPALAADVAGFRRLYLLSWAHRMTGMLALVLWGAGFAALAALGRLPAGWSGRVSAIGALLAAQGALGAVSVAAPWAGPVKTAAHVGLGFAAVGLLTGAILLTARSEAEMIRARRAGEARLYGMTTGLLHLTALQCVIGGLVAAIGAGRQYTGWPKMGGEWVPAGLWDAGLGLQNLALNPALVQFAHRGVGYLVAIFAVVVWLRARRSPHKVTRGAYTVMLVAMAFQVALGIVNVLHASPLPEALSHQFMAIVAFALVVRARHNARMPYETTIRGTIR